MCILIIKPKGVPMPHIALLKQCATVNPDGCGIATMSKIYKTLRFNTFVKYASIVSIDEPAIIHFRYATHGSICTANCHPFRDETTGISFAHNGILNVTPFNDMTDSETAFRFYFVSTIKEYGFYSKEFDALIKTMIGRSKFAFLNQDGELRTFGQFIEYNGCFYSNNSFLSKY
jgi:predicted glutamine amidotransferase